MSRGIVVLAQNSDTDYVKQAKLLALSLKVSNPKEKISLITNHEVEDDANLFDQIIPIPFEDQAKESDWKIENRWQIYHASPYDETIVMDTDMVVLQDISSWWKFLSNYNLYFVNNVYTYRGEVANTDYYRKTFVENDLPNVYAGFHYFKKCDFSLSFYKWLEYILNNWQKFYETYTPNSMQKRPSIDVSAAIAIKLLDIEDQVTNNVARYPSFTHMKPNCQNWNKVTKSWLNNVGVYVNKDAEIKVGNFVQTGILHYTDNKFIETTSVYNKFKVKAYV
jgi:hypothetical protein